VLFETAQVRFGARDRGPAATHKVVLRRRHRLRARPARRRDARVDVVKALLGACTNSRDVFLVALLATTGLRRGDALGVRLSDLHFLPASTVLGCPLEGPHLHVVPRENSNKSRVKNDRPRSVPVTSGLVGLYERYRFERDRNPNARDCDFLFVNLYRAPYGER
jgi:integrase/recombinase XerD